MLHSCSSQDLPKPGTRYGWLTLVGTGLHPCKGYQCVVLCDCGREFSIALGRLRRNYVADCGCVQRKRTDSIERLWAIARWFINHCCKEEQWKWATGFEGQILVSTCGRVYSIRFRRLMPGSPDVWGYPIVYLQGRERRSHPVHYLVLTAFRGPRPKGMQCRHLDGNQMNSHLSNLKWGTPQENTEDKRRHGTIPRGELHQNAKITESTVRAIRQEFADGSRNCDLARKYRLHDNTVRSILKRRIWSHVA